MLVLFEEGVQLHSFAHGSPVFLASFIERTVLPPTELSWRIVNLSRDDCEDSLLDFQFFSVDLGAYACASRVVS